MKASGSLWSRISERVFGLALCAVLIALCLSAEAQQPNKIPRIGFLSRDLHPSDSRASLQGNLEAFRQGLRELGYVEGKSIIIEYRYAEGRFERLPALSEELARLNVDIIVADTSNAARAAKKVTTTIPIVMANGGNPFASGLVASLARPSGNVTGLTNYSPELLGKRLELLKEVVPSVSRIAFLEADSEGSGSGLKDMQIAAEALGVTLHVAKVKGPNPDFDGAFRAMMKDRIGALVTSPDSLISLTLHRKRILELLEQNRMPAIHPTAAWVDAGGLMYYGANIPDLYRRAATYVDKILKGAKPADLPVEQPIKFGLVINLKAAKQIGLTIPPNVLARADRVIR
jgi:ABC-type uncharacterized transport system substrate-binding protein